MFLVQLKKQMIPPHQDRVVINILQLYIQLLLMAGKVYLVREDMKTFFMLLDERPNKTLLNNRHCHVKSCYCSQKGSVDGSSKLCLIEELGLCLICIPLSTSQICWHSLRFARTTKITSKQFYQNQNIHPIKKNKLMKHQICGHFVSSNLVHRHKELIFNLLQTFIVFLSSFILRAII